MAYSYFPFPTAFEVRNKVLLECILIRIKNCKDRDFIDISYYDDEINSYLVDKGYIVVYVYYHNLNGSISYQGNGRESLINTGVSCTRIHWGKRTREELLEIYGNFLIS